MSRNTPDYPTPAPNTTEYGPGTVKMSVFRCVPRYTRRTTTRPHGWARSIGRLGGDLSKLHNFTVCSRRTCGGWVETATPASTGSARGMEDLEHFRPLGPAVVVVGIEHNLFSGDVCQSENATCGQPYRRNCPQLTGMPSVGTVARVRLPRSLAVPAPTKHLFAPSTDSLRNFFPRLPFSLRTIERLTFKAGWIWCALTRPGMPVAKSAARSANAWC